MDLTGAATRDGVTKRFHLVFMPRVRYANCGLGADSGSGVDMRSEAEEVLDIRIEAEAEAVLRDDVDAATASLRFEPSAAAEEMATDWSRSRSCARCRSRACVTPARSRPGCTTTSTKTRGYSGQGKAVAIESLGDYVYELLLPSLPRFRGTRG